MRRAMVIGGALAVILLVLALVVPLLIPASTYEGKIIAAVKQATGRDLTIAGPVHLSLLPGLSLTAENVALANAPGAAPAEMLTLAKLDVGLRLIPLLSGEVDITRLVLTDPVIHLDIDKTGKGNWAFEPAAAPAASAAPQKTAKSASRLQQLNLGTVKIANGSLTYSDARSGKQEALTKLDASLKLTSLDEPLELSATASWHDQPADLSLTVKNPAALQTLLTGTPVSFKLSAKPVSIAFDGNFTLKPVPQADGNFTFSSASVRELAAWAGSPLKAGGSTFGAASLTGKLALTGKEIALSEASFSLDALKGSGQIAVLLGAKTPLLKGNLALGAVDLNPYLPQRGGVALGNAPVAAPAATAGNPAAGWSDAPLDLAALKAVDMQLGLTMPSLKFEKFEIGKSALDLQLDNGRLTAGFKQVELYGGSGNGALVLDGGGPVAGLNLTLALTNIQIQPLLEAVMGIDKLSGTGALKLAVTAHGRSQHELIATLGGNGSLNVANGAIKGVDFAALAKDVQLLSGKGSTTAAAGGETAFSSLGGTFTIANGILSNSDLAATSPVFHLTGKGTANLLDRTLDYRVEPNLAGNLQGGKNGIFGTAVPILVQGPWSNLTYRPDVESIVAQKLQGKVPAAVQGLLGGQAGNGKAASVLKGLFGH